MKPEQVEEKDISPKKYFLVKEEIEHLWDKKLLTDYWPALVFLKNYMDSRKEYQSS